MEQIIYSQESQHTDTASPRPYLLAHFPGVDVELAPVRIGQGIGFVITTPSGVDWADRDPWTYYETGHAQPTEAEVLAWVPPVIPPAEQPPLTDVEIAKNYAKAYQAAQDIIFLLMGRVAPALVAGKFFTEETVNKEGSRFTRYHQAEIEAFKLAGRHPDAGDALYAAVEASADEFPWLLANNELILGIFATTLPRNPK